MKKRTLTTLFFMVLMNLGFGQRTDFQTSQFPVIRPGLSIQPTLDNYPYLAVSVLFRNEDKLSNSDFLGNFNKMDFFYAEVSISYEGKSETAPLYFLKKEKGKFSTTVFKDRTVVRKIPVNKFSTNIPTVGITMNIKIKNEAIAVIKAITDKVTPIIQNPTSIYGAGAAQMFYGFFSDVVNQLSSSKEINVGVNFDGFTTDELGILPHSYNVIILRPNNISIPGNGFTINIDSDNKIKLFKDGKVYDEYPYFIIQTGLSNYLDITGLPSKFYYQRGNCDITTLELNRLTNDFEGVKSKLSDGQFAAEENLLKFFKYKLLIDDGSNSQGPSPDEDKLLKAYNSLFDFRKEINEIKINPILRKQYYDSIYTAFTNCINSSANSLSIYKLILVPVFRSLDKDLSQIDNSDLNVLKTYIENTKKFNFILNSKFHSNVLTLLSVAENNIYETKFDKLVKSVSAATTVTDQLKTEMAALGNLKNQYDKCKLCLDEAQKAEKNFTDLVNNQEVKRNQISDVAKQANDAYSKGYAALQKLEFTIAKTTDTISHKSTLTIPINKSNFEQAINNLKADKENLNVKFAISNFTQADLTAINSLIVSCNASIMEINQTVDKLSPIFEQNKTLFTSN